MPKRKTDTADIQPEVTETPAEIFTEEKTAVAVKLVCGGSFHVNGYAFRKGEKVFVDEETAEALISTGFFERA